MSGGVKASRAPAIAGASRHRDGEDLLIFLVEHVLDTGEDLTLTVCGTPADPRALALFAAQIRPADRARRFRSP